MPSLTDSSLWSHILVTGLVTRLPVDKVNQKIAIKVRDTYK